MENSENEKVENESHENQVLIAEQPVAKKNGKFSVNFFGIFIYLFFQIFFRIFYLFK